MAPLTTAFAVMAGGCLGKSSLDLSLSTPFSAALCECVQAALNNELALAPLEDGYKCNCYGVVGNGATRQLFVSFVSDVLCG